ncbi:Histone-lysine N-methyltransferase 2A [Lepeophtheirus salmonis]|uniref:Histone-lysine N-methyltransferase 2A n=1 Tax=Lepeophtheirus salmonis TaxID=72036 RepID=A0A7R8CQR8_LEPSM|nr:Histone-lysine N-methyltransferase 2A [Lepeophtheirus salmonis]CAF2864369.1 Histone-lysine N-methyltransferase 2A [Lepeophtheirus salmonis]
MDGMLLEVTPSHLQRIMRMSRPFMGFSEEELLRSSRQGHSLRQDLQSQSHSFMYFRSVVVGSPKEKKRHWKHSASVSSPPDSKSTKKHVNIFTDNIIIEGKRRWKPTERIKESDPKSSFGLHKNSLISKKHTTGILRSFPSYATNHLKDAPEEEVSSFSSSVIKVFKLDEKTLEYLQEPKHQIKFYTAIQRSIQKMELSPPKLVEMGHSPECSFINPAGAALISEGKAYNNNNLKRVTTNLRSLSSNSHSLAGNIVCGICGAIRYFKSVLQAKKFGTFSCDSCRKFILNLIRILKEGGQLAMKCVYNTGLCIVPPQSNISDKVRCEACWLKLCLIGYHLESGMFNKLYAILPKDVYNSPILNESTSVWNSLTPYRGEVLEIKNLPELSQPLFQRFGADSCEIGHNKTVPVSEPLRKTSSPEIKSIENPSSSSPSKSSISHIVNLRLPSNWFKKSSKILSGERKGEWDVQLITPDQKILKNNAELKLYIAKTGVIIDSNVINFSLPQNTYSTDKKISTIGRCQSKTFSTDCLEVEDEIFCNDSLSGFQDYLLSSTMKIPAKRKSSSDEKDGSINFQLSPKIVRHEAPESSSENVSPKASIVSTYAKKSESHSEETHPSTPVFAKKSNVTVDEKLTSPSSMEVFAKKSTPLNLVQSSIINVHTNVLNTLSEFKNSHAQSVIQEPKEINLHKSEDRKLDENSDETDSLPNSLALNRSRRRSKKLPLKFRDNEFYRRDDASLNEKKALNITLKKIESGSSDQSEGTTSKKLKSRRCGTCAGCIAKNCKTCNRCKDMICHGGPGNLKQACVQRICLNPSPPNDVSSASKIICHNSSRRHSRGVETYTDVVGIEQREISSLMTKFSTLKDTNESMDKLSIKIKPIETKEKPKLSYSALIAIALFNLPGQRGTLSMLYEYITEKFPYYKTVDKSGWQNSIRHNLSLNKCFVRTERTNRDGIGKGSFWIFDPEKVKNGTIRNFEKLLESDELFIESESLKENLDSSSHESRSSINEEEEDDTELENSSYRNFIDDDLERVTKNGLGVLSTTKPPNEAICFLCGSAGKNSVFIHCCVCCEPFHPFCVDPGDAPNTEEEEEWVCRRCAVCQTCGQPDGKQLKCQMCRHAYHENCLQDYQKKFLNEGNPWVCTHCLRCDSCGKSEVEHYTEGVPLCSFCCLQRQKGSFCPICKDCYEEEDYNTRMMECNRCGAWVHASCENVDIEKYQVLSSLPSNIEYVCKCDLPILKKKKLLRKDKYHLVRIEDNEEEQTYCNYTL